MPLDHYRTLGRSGLRVSPLCLGAMTFGEDLGWGSSVEESQRMIDRFVDLGGNFIDTAKLLHEGPLREDHRRPRRPPSRPP
jgi:aryl-alcohol dehydrogenase-like predicted oxidoreductase